MKNFSETVAKMHNSMSDAGEVEHLHTVWQRAFLNYTATAPNQWTDPTGEYNDDFSRPAVAIPFLRLLGENATNFAKYRDTIQSYIEFAAAVWREDFTAQERTLFLEYLLEIKANMPDVTHYAEQLADALRKAVSA